MRYTITIDPELHEAFLRSCDSQDRKGAQVLRDFMRQYVAKHGQVDAFPTPRKSPAKP